MRRTAWGLVLGCLLLAALPARAKDTVYYYYTDTLHSAVVETDAQGKVLERTHYAPYGQVLNRSLRDGPGYTGHEEDAATGLVYMQQRYYDPEAGRFLGSDPVQADAKGGSFNRYWYANDNPYRYTDPDGRCTVTQTTPCEVHGTPQNTGTPGHAEASQNIGEKMKASGQYSHIYYNSNQSTVAGNAAAGQQRADVAGVTHSGQIDTVEVTSPSQTTAQMNAKGAVMQGKLAPEVRGVHSTYSIGEGLSPEATVPRATGSALGVAGVAVGVVDALVSLKQNPHMSQAEFMTRAMGIYPLAVKVGLVPLPPPPPPMD